MVSDQPHRPVMLKEVLSFLGPQPGNFLVDATLGAGGYSQALLQAIKGHGLVVGLDWDNSAVVIAGRRLACWGEAFRPLKANFAELAAGIKGLGMMKADGIVADLGVSSMQLDEAARGFSFQREGPLDMRMDRERRLRAADVLNKASKEELERIFWKYGEERNARRIAREIVERRRKKEFQTTLELAEAIERTVSRRRGRIHPATRVFQSLRIVTNDELENLRRLCLAAADILKSGGVFVCVSYHSLEDRIVKEHFRGEQGGQVWERLTKKPLRPTPEEVAENPRSRSARLRAARRK